MESKNSEPISGYEASHDTVSKTSEKKDPDDILKYIADFVEFDFRETRNELVEEGAEFQYQISEIEELGNTLKYSIVIPGIEGKTQYDCNPKKGELTINMVGDKDVVDIYFQKHKVGINWDNCNKTDVAEQCDAYLEIKNRPLKTHTTVSIVNHGSTAIFAYRRQIMLK